MKMNKRDIANGIVFSRLNLRNDSFNDRLICQKKIYLLQGLGTDLGYSYNWYVRGPYSPALTKYLYSYLEVLSQKDFSKYILVGDTESNINTVNDLKKEAPNNLDEASWYELLASLSYLYYNSKSFMIPDPTNDNSITEKLISLKPKYNDSDCRHGLRILRNKGFLGDKN
jgi:hypothetical protein